MSMPVVGKTCETCYGEGQVPTDEGMVACPDCGGAGSLATTATLVEWRLREIERVHGGGVSEMAMDVKWLAFELRRARDALTELLTLTDELPDSSVATRLRFIANSALRMYEVQDAADPIGAKTR
jgi:hypothetical protein